MASVGTVWERFTVSLAATKDSLGHIWDTITILGRSSYNVRPKCKYTMRMLHEMMGKKPLKSPDKIKKG